MEETNTIWNRGGAQEQNPEITQELSQKLDCVTVQETDGELEQDMEQSPGGQQKNVVKAARKHFSKLGMMYFIGSVVTIVMQLAALKLMDWFVGGRYPEWRENPYINLSVALIPVWLMGMPTIILLLKKNVAAVKPEMHSMKTGHWVLAAMMSYAVLYIGNLIGLFLTFFTGIISELTGLNDFMPGSDVGININLAGGISLIPNLIFVVIGAPLIEEFVFRKLLVDRTVRYGQGAAILLSGLMFGLYHGNIGQFIYAFALGMFWAFIYVKTGKLRYTIFLHMFVNFMGSIVGVLALKMLKMDSYFEAASAGNATLIMEEIAQNIHGWILFFCYMLMIIGIVITGIVLFCVFGKKFKPAKGEIVLPKGKYFTTIILNAGIILYCLTWFGVIIWHM